ncbi:MAG: lysophospholipid acyltransferase family protein [Proteobacteria bacterium]|jgi:KDO2-lipid IV(A) lauroyltransferase|nr:lysophospholipid acyltransferase family protein [Pseudomonadota bacterium]
MRQILRVLTRLPLPLLYALGSFAYFVAFRVLRWHRALAARNLARAFPEKSDAERARILKQSYVNLGQTLAETFWGFGASAEALTGRVAIENLDLVERFVAEGRPVVLLTAHVCNWEWLLPAAGAQFAIPIDAVYKPLRVASLDEFIRATRSRFGGKPIPIQSFLFELMRRAGEARAYAMVADQTPPRNMDKHWTHFLNQDTAFFTGADKIARFLDAPVLYVAMRRVAKGRYAVRLHVLAEPPYAHDAELDVVERYARRLESEIRASPPDWLWVHNKWKYPRPA